MANKTNCVKNGIKYYRISATVGKDANGKAIRKEFYGKNKSDAETQRDEYLNNIRNGLSIGYDKIIFGKLMRTWLFEVSKVKVKATTFQRYEQIFRNYVQNSPFYGEKIKDIKQLELQRYYNKLFESGKSSNIIKNLNKLLKTFFNYAVDEGYISKNLCNHKLVVPGYDSKIKKEIEIFNRNEIKMLKKAMQGYRLKALILLALGTGLREGELLALTWDDIYIDKMEIKVEKTMEKVKIFDKNGKVIKRKILFQSPKSRSSNRIVPIPSKLIDIIKEHKLMQNKEKLNRLYNDNNLVFATKVGRPITAKNLLKSYSSLLVRANIPHKKFHALRHTYATELFKRKAPLKTAQMLLGHADIAVTSNVYTHVMPEDKKDVVEKLNSLFDD